MVKALCLLDNFSYETYLAMGCLVQVRVPFLCAIDKSRSGKKVLECLGEEMLPEFSEESVLGGDD